MGEKVYAEDILPKGALDGMMGGLSPDEKLDVALQLASTALGAAVILAAEMNNTSGVYTTTTVMRSVCKNTTKRLIERAKNAKED